MDYAKKLGLPADVRPYFANDSAARDGVPRCWQHCPTFNGERCGLLATLPDYICEPAVKAMARAIPGFLEG